MKKQEREAAEKYLLQRIFEEDPDFVDKTMEAYGVSRSTVYNYINTLQNNGELERVGGSMPFSIRPRALPLTRQETARRIGFSTATWRRFWRSCRRTCRKSGVTP